MEDLNIRTEEDQITTLKNAIQEGLDSGIATDFDPKRHLESLKASNPSK